MSIDVEFDRGVAIATINRPERRNALDAEHYADLSDFWIRARDDDDIRAAIVTGAGDKSFCAGADLKAARGQTTPIAELWLTQKRQLLNRGLEIWKPVICAVNGACIGGGMTLLLATDIRISSDTAIYALSEVKRGIIPGNGGTQRIIQQLPYAIAMEMLLTGDPIDASQALRWGLVNRIVPQADVLGVALEYARRIIENAPLALQAAKELAIRSRDVDIATGLRMEQLMGRILHGSEDASNAKAAFSKKGKPNFEGR